MAVELWRYQFSNTSAFEAATTLSDGHVVVAGWEESELDETKDFKATKINSTDGSVLWAWKSGTNEDEEINGVAAGSDGYVVLCGYTRGNWSGSNDGNWDLAAVKLNEDGQELWRLQDGTNGSDYFYAVAVGEDDSAFMSGILDEDYLLMKVDSDGNLVWTWVEDVAGGWEGMFSVIYSAEEDAVVVGGSTAGTEEGANAGNFSAIKFTSDEQEIWRWKEGTVKWDAILSIVPAEESSVIMVGNTAGSFGAPKVGTQDIVAVKLDVNGTELWRWQNGSAGNERIAAAAMDFDGFVMGGSSNGNWSDLNRGERDFIAVKLDSQDGTNEAWRWQDGTEGYDQIRAVTAVSDGLMILAGYTSGSFARNNTDGSMQGVVMLLRTGYSPGPTVSPVSSTLGPGSSPVPTPNPASTDAADFPLDIVVAVPLIAIIVVVLVSICFCRRIRKCLCKCCC